MSKFKLGLFVAIAIIAAAVCVRLGFWQVARLGERRARNALIASRLDSTAVDISALPRDTAMARFRRVRVTGAPDYEHELIYAARTRQGSPGVNLLTPIRVANTDTAVIVNRGWVYSPDGATLDRAKWHDVDTTFEGYAEELPSAGGASYVNKPMIVARPSHDVISKALPYPVATMYVVALTTTDTSPSAGRVARLKPPPLDEGSHFNYAIQWFGFAVVALVGAVVVVKQSRSSESGRVQTAGAPGDANGRD